MGEKHKKLWIRSLSLLAVFGMLGMVQFANAQCAPSTGLFQNPICAQNVGQLVQAIATAVTFIAFFIAPIAIVFTGFRFISAAFSGNEGEIVKAKKIFIWVLVGTAILVAAKILAEAVVNFAKSLA
jgi:hypothetical protein